MDHLKTTWIKPRLRIGTTYTQNTPPQKYWILTSETRNTHISLISLIFSSISSLPVFFGSALTTTTTLAEVVVVVVVVVVVLVPEKSAIIKQKYTIRTEYSLIFREHYCWTAHFFCESSCRYIGYISDSSLKNHESVVLAIGRQITGSSTLSHSVHTQTRTLVQISMHQWNICLLPLS